jgi:hypothetical protein
MSVELEINDEYFVKMTNDTPVKKDEPQEDRADLSSEDLVDFKLDEVVSKLAYSKVVGYVKEQD